MLGRTRSAERSSERLAERRRTRRRRTVVALCILILILLGTGVWGLGQNAVRVSRIEILGTDQSLASYATSAMQGSYFGIIPRDSTFFFPEESIRADILASHNDIAAVSILRNSFTGISIKVDYRVPIARWCGDVTRFNLEDSDLRLNLVTSCYVFDANGVIFSAYATTTQTVNAFRLYAPLFGDTLEPLRASIKNADKIPAAFDFARQFTALGSPAVSVVIHGDEVDNILTNGTRVTYVLGREQDAFTALVSARDNFNLSDGSVDYVDLRFDGKVYLKKK